MITAPERTEPGFLLPDRQMLEAWLDVHRSTLLVKCAGLDDAQLRLRSVPPSSMSLIGLVRHMVEVERIWFQSVLAGLDVVPIYYTPGTNPDGEFDDVEGCDVDADVALFEAATACSREIADGLIDLDAPSIGQRRGTTRSLRWVLVHMIEEYARHNGHADLLRQCIDGQTGE